MKVAIVLALLVVAASASPLLKLDELVRNARGKGGGGGDGHAQGGAGSRDLAQVGQGERDELSRLEKAFNFTEVMVKAKQEPLSVEEVNNMKGDVVKKLGEIEMFFSEAAKAVKEGIESATQLSRVEKLQGLDGFLKALMEMGEDGKDDLNEIVEVAYRAIVFGVGGNTECATDNGKCIKDKRDQLEEALDEVFEGFFEAMGGKGHKSGKGPKSGKGHKSGKGDKEGKGPKRSEEEKDSSSESESESESGSSEEEEGCLQLIKIMKDLSKGQAEPSEVAPAIVADLACIAGYLGQVKKALADMPPADENTTGGDVVHAIKATLKPSMGISANIYAVSRPLVEIRMHLFREAQKAGELPAPSRREAAKRALAALLKSLN